MDESYCCGFFKGCLLAVKDLVTELSVNNLRLCQFFLSCSFVTRVPLQESIVAQLEVEVEERCRSLRFCTWLTLV